MNKDINIKFSGFTGNPKDGLWGGHSITNPERSGVSDFGQLFYLVNLSAPSEFDTKTAGDFISETIQDTFYTDEISSKKIIERLENAILSGAKKLEFLLEREKIAGETGIYLGIVCVVIKDELIYISVLGEGKVIIKRKEEIIDITEGLADLSGRDLIKSGCGKLSLDDKVFLLSAEAALSFNETDLNNAINYNNFDFAINQKENPQNNVLMIKYENKEDEIVPVQNIEKPADEKTENIQEDKSEENIEPEEDKIELKDELEQKNEDNLDTDFEGKEEFDEEIIPTEKIINKEKSSSGIKSKFVDLKNNAITKIKNSQSLSKAKEKIADKKTYQVIIGKIKEYSIKIWELFKKYIWEGLLGFGTGKMFLKGSRGKKPIRGIIILLLLAFLLIYISIKSVDKKVEENSAEKEIETQLAEIVTKVSGGKNLSDAGDMIQGTKKIEEAIVELDTLKSKGVMVDEINAEIEKAYQTLYIVKRALVITDSDLVTNIGGYIENADAIDMEYYNDRLFVLDRTNKSIYEVTISNGEVKKIFIDSTVLSDPVSLVITERGDLFVHDQKQGLVKADFAENTLNVLTGLSASTTGEAVDISSYIMNEGTENIYTLRPSQSDVTKTTKLGSGYSFPQKRLSNQSFSDGVDIEIDGKIYVLSQANGIIRYLGDAIDPFALVDLDKEIVNPKCLELDNKFQYVFVCDNGNNRIVISMKGIPGAVSQGAYLYQVNYSGSNNYLSNLKELTIDTERRMLYILDGNNIYKVQLTDVDQYAKKYE